MKMRDARFPAQHPADVSITRESGEFVRQWVGRAFIRNGDFARAEHLLNEQYVVANRSRNRRRRHVVAAAPDTRAQSVFLQRFRPREQTGHGLHRRVYAKTTDHARDSSGNELIEMQFRCLRAETVLTAAAKQMFVRIDKPRHDETVRRVDKLRFELELQQSVAIDGAHLLKVIADDE